MHTSFHQATPFFRLVARPIRWILMFTGGLLLLLSLVIVALGVLEVSVDISGARKPVEKAASNALNRPVHLDGSIVLLPSLRPTLKLDRLRIGHPRGWPEADFAQLERLEAQIALLPLLWQRIHIDDLEVDRLDLKLETNSAGESNWLPPRDGAADAGAGSSAARLVEIGKLAATDLNIAYRNAQTGQSGSLHLASVDGAAKQDQPLMLSIQGALQEIPFEASLTGGLLSGLTTYGSPWPVDLSLATLGADLRIEGSVVDPLLATSFALAVELKIPSTEQIRELYRVQQPIFETLDLHGQLEGSPGVFRFDNIEANVDDVPVRAQIIADLSGEKPRLEGYTHAGLVDVSRFFEAIKDLENPRAGAQPSAVTQATDDRLSRLAGQPDPIVREWDLDLPFIDTAFLQRFDAHLGLTVDEISGGPAVIADATLALDVSDGVLSAPARLHFAGVPFTGEFSFGPGDESPSIKVALAATSSEIGDLARLLANAAGVEGRFDQATLDFSCQGKTLRDLVETSALDFSLVGAYLTYGNESGGAPVEFTLGQLEMTFQTEQGSRVYAEGALLDEPFAVEAFGGNFKDKFLTGNWPVRISATGGGARFNANGLVATEEETRLNFDLAGDHIGKLSRWLGVVPLTDYSYRLQGELISSAVATRVLITSGHLDNSRFDGEIGVSTQDGQPLSRLRLHADLVDVNRLLELFPESGTKGQTIETGSFSLDAPILPKGINLFDSDVDLYIARLETNLIMAEELRLSSRIREGYVERAPVQALIAGTRLEGNIGLDLRSDISRLNLDLNASAIDLGKMLTNLGLVDSLTMTADDFGLSLELEGSSPREMLAKYKLEATVQGGLWEFNDYRMSRGLDVVLDQARLAAHGPEPITLEVEGRIDQTPLLLKLQTDPLANFVQANDSIDLAAEINIARASIRLSTLAQLPIQTDQLQFNLAVDGERVDDLDELLGVSLPPWGPYSMRGKFTIGSTGYSVSGLHLGIGQSQLNGDINLSMYEEPPRLTLELAAESIQLDDFKTGHWSVDGKADPADEPANVKTTVADTLALFTPEFMSRLNARLQLRVNEVVSGEDRLGHGNLSAKLEAGRLSVEPLSLGIPGGDVELAFELEPTDSDVGMSLDAKIENLDYGYLARRIDPETSVSGLFSVDTALSTRGPDLDRVMRHANGNIDFAIWPEEINARLFDLWATNLLAFVLPRLDTSADSRVNCVISRFQIEDGLMQPNVIFADTTRVQASATGMIDLKEQNLEFQIRPRPKRPEFFSAQTRLRVRGSFQDFSAGASVGAIAGSAARIITSPIVVPFQRMLTESPSVDGEYECRKAWEREF